MYVCILIWRNFENGPSNFSIYLQYVKYYVARKSLLNSQFLENLFILENFL